MIDKILEFLTKRKIEEKCHFCKRKFTGKSYKTYYRKLGCVNISDFYCSKKCEKAMIKAIKKCFDGKILTKQEKVAVKDLRYVDI